jgi:hypothetical protein
MLFDALQKVGSEFYSRRFFSCLFLSICLKAFQGYPYMGGKSFFVYLLLFFFFWAMKKR